MIGLTMDYSGWEWPGERVREIVGHGGGGKMPLYGYRWARLFCVIVIASFGIVIMRYVGRREGCADRNRASREDAEIVPEEKISWLPFLLTIPQLF